MATGGLPIVKVYYGKPMLPDVSRVLACLYEKEIEFKLVNMYEGEHMPPDFLRLQAAARLPVPCLEDGITTLFESRPICRYLIEKYGDRGNRYLLGRDVLERASIEQWLKSEEQSFDPPSWSLLFHLAFPPFPHLPEPDHAIITENERRLAKVLDVYEQRLGESNYLAGNKFSLADLAHLPHSHYLAKSKDLGHLFDSRKNVSKWWSKISKRSSWKEVVKLLDEVGIVKKGFPAAGESSAESFSKLLQHPPKVQPIRLGDKLVSTERAPRPESSTAQPIPQPNAMQTTLETSQAALTKQSSSKTPVITPSTPQPTIPPSTPSIPPRAPTTQSTPQTVSTSQTNETTQASPQTKLTVPTAEPTPLKTLSPEPTPNAIVTTQPEPTTINSRTSSVSAKPTFQPDGPNTQPTPQREPTSSSTAQATSPTQPHNSQQASPTNQSSHQPGQDIQATTPSLLAAPSDEPTTMKMPSPETGSNANLTIQPEPTAPSSQPVSATPQLPLQSTGPNTQPAPQPNLAVPSTAKPASTIGQPTQQPAFPSTRLIPKLDHNSQETLQADSTVPIKQVEIPSSRPTTQPGPSAANAQPASTIAQPINSAAAPNIQPDLQPNLTTPSTQRASKVAPSTTQSITPNIQSSTYPNPSAPAAPSTPKPATVDTRSSLPPDPNIKPVPQTDLNDGSTTQTASGDQFTQTASRATQSSLREDQNTKSNAQSAFTADQPTLPSTSTGSISQTDSTSGSTSKPRPGSTS